MPLRPQDYPNLPVVQEKMRSGTPVHAQDYPDLSVAQVKFDEKTGPDGRLIWTNAPSGELIVSVSAHGFTLLRSAATRADGAEHLITLTQSTVVTGSVRDDSIGAAIPHFRVVLGWPEIQPFFGQTNMHWIRNRAYEFRDGTYSQELDRALIIGEDNPGYVLKFEATDYEPFVAHFPGRRRRSSSRRVAASIEVDHHYSAQAQWQAGRRRRRGLGQPRREVEAGAGTLRP